MKKIVSLLLIVVIMSMSLSNIVFAINEISDDIIKDEQKNDNSLVENNTSFDSKENQDVTTDNENTEKENNNEEQEDSNKEIINEENENNINEDEQEIEQYENIEEIIPIGIMIKTINKIISHPISRPTILLTDNFISFYLLNICMYLL